AARHRGGGPGEGLRAAYRAQAAVLRVASGLNRALCNARGLVNNGLFRGGSRHSGRKNAIHHHRAVAGRGSLRQRFNAVILSTVVALGIKNFGGVLSVRRGIVAGKIVLQRLADAEHHLVGTERLVIAVFIQVGVGGEGDVAHLGNLYRLAFTGGDQVHHRPHFRRVGFFVAVQHQRGLAFALRAHGAQAGTGTQHHKLFNFILCAVALVVMVAGAEQQCADVGRGRVAGQHGVGTQELIHVGAADGTEQLAQAHTAVGQHGSRDVIPQVVDVATGNGHARHHAAAIGFIGYALGAHNLYIGRVNRHYTGSTVIRCRVSSYRVSAVGFNSGLNSSASTPPASMSNSTAWVLALFRVKVRTVAGCSCRSRRASTVARSAQSPVRVIFWPYCSGAISTTMPPATLRSLLWAVGIKSNSSDQYK